MPWPVRDDVEQRAGHAVERGHVAEVDRFDDGDGDRVLGVDGRHTASITPGRRSQAGLTARMRSRRNIRSAWRSRHHADSESKKTSIGSITRWECPPVPLT